MRFAAALLLAAAGCLLVPGRAGAIPADAPPTGMVCSPGAVSGTTHTFDLVAQTGYIDTPDGNSVFMWSYAEAGGHFQSPGPVLCVTQGQTVVVNLTNNLAEPASIVFPGQDAAVAASGGSAGLLTTEAAANGGTVSYSFVAGSPGTYLYESGTDIAKQIEMGLYGALIVRPAAGPGYAYGTSTAFDSSREYLLLLSEIDSDLHHAVETGAAYDVNARRDRYFAVNGREFPDTIQDNGSSLLPNQPYGALVRIQPTTPTSAPALIRMINVGALNHPFHPHGNHTTQIAQDGRLLPAATEHFGETIASGQTLDFLLRWDDQDKWDAATNPLPVPPPNYRDVFFKDSNTWYGGNPYLGSKGILPSGVVSQNICGEWYFPWHSHALNEFTNYDQGFGGMATLLRVDPPGGCFAAPATATPLGSVLKSGSVAGLAADDTSYYAVNPRTTTRPTATTAAQTSITVASATGFPATNGYYVRIDNEVLRVTAGAGTATWTVQRGQLGTTAATHATGAVVTALATDFTAGFTGVPAGSQHLKVTYKGANCATTTATTCTALTANLPQQTVKICDWTVGGAAGCSTPTSPGWVTLPPPPAQPQGVGSTAVGATWSLPTSAAYLNAGQVRVLVHTERYTSPSPAAFSTWGNLLALTYDAP
ncbi:multicopper oxidase domain-containing protein [Actinoplanes sp. KI2]|uniref:multicopper oxidase domain-containing protein n=1 Tax=Actinoplanes sp. KI2 TaxID=2983315 RepID=UPI0021D5F7C1|nr:multicopper oxidase domain-containing protein [Actinoplanes sp. KI2]MCU7722965.1 multicopper oxidase domain-containing protein [Actinoplanes sp. KI2]